LATRSESAFFETLAGGGIFGTDGNVVTNQGRIFATTGISLNDNNLLNNTIQAFDDNPSQNLWDNGYPSGGNFWSDFTGVDNCSGPQQNICPGPDGIGDTPYTFSFNMDQYPLMKLFQ